MYFNSPIGEIEDMRREIFLTPAKEILGFGLCELLVASQPRIWTTFLYKDRFVLARKQIGWPLVPELPYVEIGFKLANESWILDPTKNLSSTLFKTDKQEWAIKPISGPNRNDFGEKK